jgi:sensor histidine kinase YesM
LQPLAENAIKHAIAQAVNGGKISIAANLENEHLIIRMADTGSGLASTSDSKPSGVGLRNTLDRLDEFYGDTYTFSLENSANGGLQVYMKLPLEKQPS